MHSRCVDPNASVQSMNEARKSDMRLVIPSSLHGRARTIRKVAAPEVARPYRPRVTSMKFPGKLL